MTSPMHIMSLAILISWASSLPVVTNFAITIVIIIVAYVAGYFHLLCP